MYNIASNVKDHRLYSDFLIVKDKLKKHQFVCWIVGGAVRDFCLNRDVDEFDLVTDATTENLKIIFSNAVLVGESFGVLKIPTGQGDFFDLSTFRQESDYLDGRRPSKVESATPLKDSERRDFTINALYWDDEQKRIIDYKQGLFDLQSKNIVCVGTPDQRMSEDYLRILRLVRFSAQLGFSIEKNSLAAAFNYKQCINKISGERIWSELKKIGPIGNWKRALESKLFLEILEVVFETSFAGFKVPGKIEFNSIVDLNYAAAVCIYLLNPELDFFSILKKRLKLSGVEIKKYILIRQLLKNDMSVSIYELAYELERNAEKNSIFEYLNEIALIDKNKYTNVKNILKQKLVPLVKAEDLLGLIPQFEIANELRICRINQWNKTYKTKACAVEYLSNKYAKIGEKT